MAEYYVDPLAGGTDDGTSWTDAWSTLQRAIDGTGGTRPAAGDSVYLKHGTGDDETPTAAISWTSGASGTYAGRIRFIGTNSSGTVDGTRYVINWAANAVHGLAVAGMDFLSLENIELVSSATGSYDGITTATSSQRCVFQNLYVHGWPRNGVQATTLFSRAQHIRSRYSGCGNDGLSITGTSCVAYGCTCDANTRYGMSLNGNSEVVGSLIYDNGDHGISTFLATLISGSVIDNNGGAGIRSSSTIGLISGCRITNNSGYGISDTGATQRSSIVGCFIDNNTSGDTPNGAGYQELDPDGTGSWNDFATNDIDQGYVDLVNLNYNLRPDATLLSKGLKLQQTV